MDQTRKRGLAERIFKSKVSGDHEGDLYSDRPVTIETNALVDGRVAAPRITVKGLIRGDIVTRTLVIQAGGCVLGDVWTSSLQKKPGGSIHGWISPLSDELIMFLDGDRPLADLEVLKGPPDEFIDHSFSLETMRSQLAEAVLSRHQVERELEDRIAQAIRVSQARGDELELALDQAHESEKGLKAKLSEIQEREAAVSQSLSEERSSIIEVTQTLSELEESLKALAGQQEGESASGGASEEPLIALEQKLEDQRQRIVHLKKDLDGANQQLEEQKLLVEQQRELLAKDGAIIVDLNEKLDGSGKQVKEQERLLDDLGNNLVQSQERVEEQHRDMIKANEQIKALETLIEENQTELDDARAIRQHAEESLSLQESEILRLRAELEVTQAESYQDRASLSELREQIDAQTEIVASLQTRLADEAGARRETEVLEDQLEQSRRLAQAQRTLAETRASTVADLQSMVDRLQRRNRRLEAERASEQGRQSEHEAALEEARKRIFDLETDLKTAGGHVAVLQAQRGRKSEQFRKVTGAAKEQVEKTQGALQRAQREYVLAQEQAVAWREEAERMEAELAEIRTTHDELKTDLHLARSIIAELNGDIGWFEDQLDNRNETVAKLYADLAEMKLESDRVDESAQVLQATSQAQVNRISELERQLAAQEVDLERQKNQLADMLAWAERSGLRRNQSQDR